MEFVENGNTRPARNTIEILFSFPLGILGKSFLSYLDVLWKKIEFGCLSLFVCTLGALGLGDLNILERDQSWQRSSCQS